jgi:DNA-binding GntR family transcriptional regulator
MPIAELDLQPALIDQVHDRLLTAIVDGTLAPGQRLTQDSIAEMLGVSRQPVSHAIQVLKRRGLLVEAGKRGVIVAPIDGRRIVDLYRVREALDGLAAELAAARMRSGAVTPREVGEATSTVAVGQAIAATAPVAMLIDADVAFHSGIHRLSGNSAIGETVAEQWPHFRRSMGLVLATVEMRIQVWGEHREILDAILSGDVRRAGRLARTHTAQAGADTARRIDHLASVA